MTDKTQMTAEECLEAFVTVNDLARESLAQIISNKQSPESIAALTNTLKAFNAGTILNDLERFLSTKTSAGINLEALFKICDVPLNELPLDRDCKKYFTERGIRYIGELCYVNFRKYGKAVKEVIAAAKSAVDFTPDLDPIALGWRPHYWNDPTFLETMDIKIAVKGRIRKGSRSGKYYQASHFLNELRIRSHSSPNFTKKFSSKMWMNWERLTKIVANNDPAIRDLLVESSDGRFLSANFAPATELLGNQEGVLDLNKLLKIDLWAAALPPPLVDQPTESS